MDEKYNNYINNVFLTFLNDENIMLKFDLYSSPCYEYLINQLILKNPTIFTNLDIISTEKNTNQNTLLMYLINNSENCFKIKHLLSLFCDNETKIMKYIFLQNNLKRNIFEFKRNSVHQGISE